MALIVWCRDRHHSIQAGCVYISWGNFVLIKCLCVHRFQMGGWDGVDLVQIIWASVTVLKVNTIKVELSRVYVSERSYRGNYFICYDYVSVSTLQRVYHLIVFRYS